MPGLTGGRWRSGSHGEPARCARRETGGTEPDHLPLADQPAAYLTGVGVDELVIDKAHYRGHPDCKTLVCFIYDPEHRLTNPDALESDVSGDEDGLATRVVVAPRSS